MSKEESPALTAHQKQINCAINFCEDRKWYILAAALRHCWGNGFLDVFRKYFKDHAALFRGMTYGLGKNEHTLEQHECFTQYLQLYEDRLADYIGRSVYFKLCTKHVFICCCFMPEKDPNGPRASIQDFYVELNAAKNEGQMDAGTQEFIHCLVASADYDSFYSVMVREGQKLQMLEAQGKIGTSVPITAEAKGGAAEERGGGGKGVDDDDGDDKGYK
jgi:hypothetical protein